MLDSPLKPVAHAASTMVAAHSVKTERFLLFLILAGLAARAALVFSLNINWDEFFYLSHIYGYERGELAVQLQMFHVHLLGWLTSVSGNEVDQILAARVLMDSDGSRP